MQISVTVEDKRASTWFKAFRILVLVSAIVWAWKSGYDQGGEDMLNAIFFEPGSPSQKEDDLVVYIPFRSDRMEQ